MKNNILGRLGICRRSGHLSIGNDAVAGLIKHGRAKIVLLASDLSDKTAKELRFLSETHPTPIRTIASTKDEIGRALGLEKPVGVVATDDRGFGAAFLKDCPDKQEDDAL